MSKIKKVLALLLAMTMVMGMSMTTFAEGEIAKIEVEGAAEDAKMTYVQVIEPDRTTTTGWAFCSGAIAQAYMSAFDMTNAQAVIEAMIADPTGNINAAKIGTALSNVAGINGLVFAEMANPQTVDSAGVYAIRATEEGYTYNNMAAYIGFGVVGDSYPALLDKKLSAKKAPTVVIKESDDSDDVVAIGDVITYTVKAYVPFINPNDTDKTFFVYDNLTGATYDLTGATVKMAGTSIENEYPIVLNTDGTTGFSIDLSKLIDNANSNAGKEIVVTYKAVVTAETAENKAAAGHKGGNQFGSDSTKTYTGKITLTKYNDDDATLAGAGFKVTKTDSETPLTALKFVKDSDGVYTYSPTGTVTVTEVFTGAEGTLVVKGLDVGTYHFEETTAPEGYSINADGADATLTVTEKATKIVTAEAELTDTKLSALPSTGGIGTTIFTIGGCLIMLIAAFLFFAIRRKSVK